MTVNRAAIIGLFLMMILSGTAFGQIEQVNRKRTRNNQVLITAEDVENQRSADEARLPAPKPAVLNVDVQIVLSKADVKTFAEAKMAEAKRVVDGDPLSLYVKFKTKLGDYVIASRDADDRQKIHYNLYAEVAPKGETAALHQVTIEFKKEDLAATEFKVSLAPALFGRNKSLPLFLMMTGTTRSGVWNNDVRLTNNVNMPRALTDNLAITPVVLDLSAGSAKYRKMESEYDSIVIRGTPDFTKLPIAGSFASDQLKVRLMEKLAAEKIEPANVYFSGDERLEFASFTPSLKKARKVFATFTYRTREECFYGVAEIVELFDLTQVKYGEPEFRLEKGLSVPCSEVN